MATGSASVKLNLAGGIFLLMELGLSVMTSLFEAGWHCTVFGAVFLMGTQVCNIANMHTRGWVRGVPYSSSIVDRGGLMEITVKSRCLVIVVCRVRRYDNIASDNYS